MKRDLDAVIMQPPVTPLAIATPAVFACLLSVAALLAVYWQTAAAIVMTWWRSETFAHGFVIVPICLWFAWRKRAELAHTPAQPWWPGLLVLGAAGLLWLVASAADVLVVREFALAFMLQAAIVTVVGLRVARVILFSSPWDFYGRERQLAPWVLTGPGATPAGLWFAAYHKKERTAALIASAYKGLRIPAANIRVFTLEPGRFAGDNPYHVSVVGNGTTPRSSSGLPSYADDWRFLLGSSQ